MEFQHHYQYEIINTENVFEAARYLVTTELYKKMKINLDTVWRSRNIQEFIVDPEDNINDGTNAAVNEDAGSNEDENNTSEQNDEIEQTDCQQVTLLDSNEGIEFAPGEGQTPLPLLKD